MSTPDNEQVYENEVASYKRRLAALQEENEGLRQGHTKLQSRSGDKFIAAGRLIRRLVCLADRVEDLIGENDRHICENGSTDVTEDQESLHRSYCEMIKWIPWLPKELYSNKEDHELVTIYQQLNKGADGARGDDAASLKTTVITWVMTYYKNTPEPALELRDKSGRGFYHDATARLLCPADFDWNKTEHRTRIRNYHPDFLVTENSWPRMLYKDEVYNPEDPSEGLFKNLLLVKTFKHVFTSPSSVDSDFIVNDDKADNAGSSEERPQKRLKGMGDRRTRSNVAALLGMKAVTPRAIAYAAVQASSLQFSLSSCSSWCIRDEDFDYRGFHNNIISYFENVSGMEDKAEIQALLLWWNRAVFGRTNASVYRPQPTDKMSVAETLRKRHHNGNSNIPRSSAV